MLDLRVDHDPQWRLLQVRELRQHLRLRLEPILKITPEFDSEGARLTLLLTSTRPARRRTEMKDSGFRICATYCRWKS